MEPNNRIEDLIMITERLVGVLERENDALSNQRNAELRDILDEKVTLSRVYESRMQVISEKPEILNDVKVELRERLSELGLEVNELIKENAKLLKIAMTVSRRVVELIAEAVRDASPSAGTYGAKGTTDSGVANAESKRPAFSLDQIL
jgi:hypothetical protein